MEGHQSVSISKRFHGEFCRYNAEKCQAETKMQHLGETARRSPHRAAENAVRFHSHKKTAACAAEARSLRQPE